MDPSLDLVERYKLDVEFLDDVTQHTYLTCDRSRGLRKVKIVKRWKRVLELGHGSFGVVWLEVEEAGAERAVKEISKRGCSRNNIDYRKELATMAKLSEYESSFVRLEGWYETLESIFLAMEYFKHGDLQQYMDKPLPETQIKIIIVQLLEGLKVMHRNGFTHRDLKPKNIFVVEKEPYFWVKIGDFGITKRILNDQTFLKTEVGTREYLAPEVLGYVEEETLQYTNAVDIWSMGCICHRLLTLRPPFAKLNALAPYCCGKIALPIEALGETATNHDAIALVKHMMAAEPASRPSAEVALQCPWLSDIDDLEGQLERSCGYTSRRSPVTAGVNVEESETTLIESYHQSLYHDLDILNGIESAIERSSDLVQTMNMTDNLEAALHLAVEKRYDGAVRSLLCYGICMGLDINSIIPNSGRTALHCACAMVEVDIARLLLNAGANVNLKDKYGSTALHIVLQHEESQRRDSEAPIELVKMLLDHGADLMLKNKEGYEPLVIALRNGENARLMRLLHSATEKAGGIVPWYSKQMWSQLET